jgi:hypothetical protein
VTAKHAGSPLTDDEQYRLDYIRQAHPVIHEVPEGREREYLARAAEAHRAFEQAMQEAGRVFRAAEAAAEEDYASEVGAQGWKVWSGAGASL